MKGTTEPRPAAPHANCFKEKHATREAADAALAFARRKGRLEKHVYYCPVCLAYHLTKMDRR